MNTELGIMELNMEELEEALQKIMDNSSPSKDDEESVLQKQMKEREELLENVRKRRLSTQSISIN
ncbi:MAG: hypothetical protein SVJ22_03285 [Halobacteriota archaeon]|nr:hypothetical protein [Halobacteriota archaeon]